MSKAIPELQRHLGKLFEQSLKVSRPIETLHLIREKMNARGLQSFDKEDILQEMGQLQSIVGQLHSEMLKIHDLLKHA